MTLIGKSNSYIFAFKARATLGTFGHVVAFRLVEPTVLSKLSLPRVRLVKATDPHAVPQPEG